MRHLERQGDRDEFVLFGGEVYSLWNLATDIAINPMVDKELPPIPLMPSQFDLPEGEDAEFYYDVLLELRDVDSWKLPLSEITTEEEVNINQGVGDSANAKGCESASRTSPDKAPGEEPVITKYPCLVDDHDGWETDEDDLNDPESRDSLIRQAVTRAFERAHHSHGLLPAFIEEQVESWISKPEIPWTSLLRSFLGRAARVGTCFTWKRESRRFGELYKGKRTVRKLRVVVAIDTSGSISSAMLGRFVSEINAIASCYQSDITVVQCDAEVQKVVKLRGQKLSSETCYGRGGTDFTPVFELVQKENMSPNALIYLTDLYGLFPSKSPRYPVIWVRTPDSMIDSVPFGKIVKMPEGGSQ